MGRAAGVPGRGLAVRAARAVREVARTTGTHRYLHAFPGVGHAASNAVCRGAGFTLLGQVDAEYPKGRRIRSNDWRVDLEEETDVMCRSIKTLRPPVLAEEATEDEIRAAALQYVRKVSGFRAPAAHNQEVFDRAVEAVTAATTELLADLEIRGGGGARKAS